MSLNAAPITRDSVPFDVREMPRDRWKCPLPTKDESRRVYADELRNAEDQLRNAEQRHAWHSRNTTTIYHPDGPKEISMAESALNSVNYWRREVEARRARLAKLEETR